MGDAIHRDRILQRSRNGFLADQLVELLGAIAPRQHGVARRGRRWIVGGRVGEHHVRHRALRGFGLRQ